VRRTAGAVKPALKVQIETKYERRWAWAHATETSNDWKSRDAEFPMIGNAWYKNAAFMLTGVITE
jgi:hypothetical protein